MCSTSSRSIKPLWILKIFIQWEDQPKWIWFCHSSSHLNGVEESQSQISDMLSERRFWRKWRLKSQRVRPNWSMNLSWCLVTVWTPTLISFCPWCTCSLLSHLHASQSTIVTARTMPKEWRWSFKTPVLWRNSLESTLLETWEELQFSVIKRRSVMEWSWNCNAPTQKKLKLKQSILLMTPLMPDLELSQPLSHWTTSALESNL